MATLSQQLKQISQGINQQAQAQFGAAQQANTFQTQQAMTQAQAQPGGIVDVTKTAQQFAPAVTQAQSQASLQAQQAAAGALMGSTQATAERQSREEALRQRRQQLSDEVKIAERQRAGELKQNSAELRQAKNLAKDELEVQKRMQSAGIEFDNSISFLTRKQREDLAGIGGYLRQQIFDSRLAFDISEGERRFTNNRQLADFAVMSARNEEQFKDFAQSMQQAYDKDMIMLQAAQAKIINAIKFEAEKSKQDRNQAFQKELYEKKKALDDEIRRKKAQVSAVKTVFKGAAYIVGAIYAVPSGGTSMVAAHAASTAIDSAEVE